MLNKYYYEVLEEINVIDKILRIGQKYTDLFNGETFYKGLLNRMPRIKIATGFDGIISHDFISVEQRHVLNSLREKLQITWFDFNDLLYFVAECKLSITPEALQQLKVRFKNIKEPMKSIHEILNDIHSSLQEENEGEIDFVDNSEFWEDFS